MCNMQEVLEFELNGTKYKIFLADTINDDDSIMGYTVFIDGVIYIKQHLQPSQELKTVRHELTHVWLYEYGHNQHDEDKTFNFEDICEIVACSYDFITEILNRYRTERLEGSIT